MSGDSDWMVDRRGWYAERERVAKAPGTQPRSDAGDSSFDAIGYEAAYPSPMPPASDSGKKEKP